MEQENIYNSYFPTNKHGKRNKYTNNFKRKSSYTNNSYHNTNFKGWNVFPRRYMKKGQNYSKKQNYSGNRAKKKEPSRPNSPLCGSEEYTQRKIEQTSELIKKRLLCSEDKTVNQLDPEDIMVSKSRHNLEETDSSEIINYNSQSKTSNKKSVNKSNLVNKSSNKHLELENFDAQEIHNKILNHIASLDYKKMVNLINSESSSYDVAINQIQKQKRLELSKAFRDLYFDDCTESADVINSILPDINIKIEDLPKEVIRELSTALDLNSEEDLCNILSRNEISVKQNDTVSRLENNDRSDRSQSPDVEMIIEKPECIVIEEEDNSDDMEDNIDKCKTSAKKCKSEVLSEADNNEISSQNTVDIPLHTCDDIDTDIGDTSIPIISSEMHSKGSTLESKTVAVQTSSCSYSEYPNTLEEAISTMFEIDLEIERLNRTRKQLFINLSKVELEKQKESCVVSEISQSARKYTTARKRQGTDDIEAENNRVKKKRCASEHSDFSQSDSIRACDENLQASGALENNSNNTESQVLNQDEVISEGSQISSVFPKSKFKLPAINEKVLVIRAHMNKIVVGTEKGSLFYFTVKTGQLMTKLQPFQYPVSCLNICAPGRRGGKRVLDVIVGSPFVNGLKRYDFNNIKPKSCGKHWQYVHFNGKPLCTEVSWDFLFIGCHQGFFCRYSLKSTRIEFTDTLGSDDILVIKAAQEGARKIVLIGSRNSPVFIRDAFSGLHMRTLEQVVLPTVYSVVLHKSIVYCGTTSHDILAYSFYDGQLMNTLSASSSKGICCMKMFNDILFAGCYDGNIYAYNTEQQEFVGKIKGPGGPIQTMELLSTKILVATMTSKLQAVYMPPHILEYCWTDDQQR